MPRRAKRPTGASSSSRSHESQWRVSKHYSSQEDGGYINPRALEQLGPADQNTLLYDPFFLLSSVPSYTADADPPVGSHCSPNVTVAARSDPACSDPGNGPASEPISPEFDPAENYGTEAFSATAQSGVADNNPSTYDIFDYTGYESLAPQGGFHVSSL
ncbi:hypothetical protein OQA88_11685 [Cercophora sp. LCS_1]